MLHILLGVNPLSIALAPFKPTFTDEQIVKGKDLNLHCHEEAEIKLLPSISAYVGADIVSGLASIKPSEERKNYLFMDLGTNGELALFSHGSVTCCATAAGQYFCWHVNRCPHLSLHPSPVQSPCSSASNGWCNYLFLGHFC